MDGPGGWELMGASFAKTVTTASLLGVFVVDGHLHSRLPAYLDISSLWLENNTSECFLN